MTANIVRDSHDARPVSTASVLSEIVRTGRTFLPSGESVDATGFIDATCGTLLHKVIRTVRPKAGVEVGLAFGISTLYILEALRETGGEKLIGIDPAQHDDHWRGGGLHNIRQAGYESLYEFHENTSQQVLPALAGHGQRIGFAFIDGWHTFDHVLVDFFYIDQMLDVGGAVVFDDAGYPAIKRVCDFIVTNRNYEVFESVRVPIERTSTRRLKHAANRVLDPLVRTDKTPALDARRKEFEISDAYFLALRKRGDDARRWDHFVHF